MPVARKGYSVEMAYLGALLKRIDKDSKPPVWRAAVREKTQDLMRLLLAADHNPIGDNAAERPGFAKK